MYIYMIRMCYMQLYAIKLCNRDNKKKKKKKKNMKLILFLFLATCWITTTLQLIQFLDRGDT